ncbi:MAG: copper-binding protein [Burkholderiaceae bacterium]|nr:copper-binding protein [Burkholderiaceae bacterium]
MITHRKALLSTAIALAMLAPLVAAADDSHHKAAPAASAATDMADGEVRKVDLEGGKVTLKHGEIKSLEMPGMTMVFAVKDKAMLEKLKTGDKVKFKAVNEGGKFTVTEIRSAQ